MTATSQLQIRQVEQTLLRTSRQLREVLLESDIDPETFEYDSLILDTCDNCSIWWPKTRLVPDLDGSPICHFCLVNYGR